MLERRQLKKKKKKKKKMSDIEQMKWNNLVGKQWAPPFPIVFYLNTPKSREREKISDQIMIILPLCHSSHSQPSPLKRQPSGSVINSHSHLKKKKKKKTKQNIKKYL